MRTRFQALVMLGALTVPAAAMPADEKVTDWEEGPSVEPEGATPPNAPPTGPAPPSEPAPPPPARVPQPPEPEEQQLAEATPQGQWIHTQQYGWVWMPYSDRYLYLPPYGPPYAFLYYPDFGWTWLAAPWIFGWGPWPSFGYYGAVHYGWYGHGWWRQPWRWYAGPPRGWVGPYYRPGPGRPARPAPGAPGFRGAPGARGAPGPGVRSSPSPGMRSAPSPGMRSAPSPGARPAPGPGAGGGSRAP